MKYIFDHDLHIHSKLSSCSGDPEQTPERILQYAEEFGLNTVCVSDHFWDSEVQGASNWYAPQNFEHISAIKPLPQKENIRFLFGCETEMDRFGRIGISKKRFSEFDFVIVPITHFHMRGFTISEEDAALPKTRAKAWIEHFDALLNMDLPFEKIGIAHLTSGLIAPTREEFFETFSNITDDDLYRLFKKAAALKVGIELNSGSILPREDEDGEPIYRPYIIAKEAGCKFYCGSDAHRPAGLVTVKERIEKATEIMGIEESDKFLLK